MTEKTIETYLVKQVKQMGGKAIKLNPIVMVGLPDKRLRTTKFVDLKLLFLYRDSIKLLRIWLPTILNFALCCEKDFKSDVGIADTWNLKVASNNFWEFYCLQFWIE